MARAWAAMAACEMGVGSGERACMLADMLMECSQRTACTARAWAAMATVPAFMQQQYASVE
eukprot:355715-Chlamydomonas_euryale.AAC.1